jgi:hypothetical protein
MCRRAFVAAILIYVVLDLSSPWIPGAFMFDVTESVESYQGRARAAAVDGVVPTSLARDPVVSSRPSIDLAARPGPAASLQCEWRPHLSRQSRTVLHPPPASEDSH